MATHRFEPARYYTTIGVYDPVLRVDDGDTIITTTVDSRGKAAPGDTLAVRLDRLAPNRARGYSSSVIAPNVVDPWYVRELPERQDAEWRIDQEAETATLISPETKLGGLVLPLAPMLGCFGITLGGGQAISTATSAEHGGNMDYRGFREGVTAYFPVFVEGAWSVRAVRPPESKSPSAPSTTSAIRRSRTLPRRATHRSTFRRELATRRARSQSATCTPPRSSSRARRKGAKSGCSAGRQPTGE